jgi:hypothetical protein
VLARNERGLIAKHTELNMRFEVFPTEKIQVKLFWVVTPCSAVVGY